MAWPPPTTVKGTHPPPRGDVREVAGVLVAERGSDPGGRSVLRRRRGRTLEYLERQRLHRGEIRIRVVEGCE